MVNFRRSSRRGGGREFYFTELHCDDPYRVRPRGCDRLPIRSFIILLLFLLYFAETLFVRNTEEYYPRKTVIIRYYAVFNIIVATIIIIIIITIIWERRVEPYEIYGKSSSALTVRWWSSCVYRTSNRKRTVSFTQETRPFRKRSPSFVFNVVYFVFCGSPPCARIPQIPRNGIPRHTP